MLSSELLSLVKSDGRLLQVSALNNTPILKTIQQKLFKNVIED